MFIEYTFSVDEGKVLHYRVEFNRVRHSLLDKTRYPFWTLLDFQQCPNCPLSVQHHSHCPVAIDAHEILLEFTEIVSCKEIDIYVKTPELDCFKRTDAQTGLRSLIGFVMASSTCPVLSTMRGTSYYYLPFSSLDETVFQVTSAYLLNQYYVYKKGDKINLEFTGLKTTF